VVTAVALGRNDSKLNGRRVLNLGHLTTGATAESTKSPRQSGEDSKLLIFNLYAYVTKL